MFELPGLEGVQEVVVNEDAITAEAAPLLIYADKDAPQVTA
jgi:ATP-dependent Clp protease ATP-binding subunit ClpX